MKAVCYLKPAPPELHRYASTATTAARCSPGPTDPVHKRFWLAAPRQCVIHNWKVEVSSSTRIGSKARSSARSNPLTIKNRMVRMIPDFRTITFPQPIWVDKIGDSQVKHHEIP
jgi:hypothetical protein